MAATRTPGNATLTDATGAFVAEQCSSPQTWGNDAGDTYRRHVHGYHKVLFCLAGSIVFHTDDGDLELTQGDRLDLEPGTAHAATVGHGGCRCVEASR